MVIYYQVNNQQTQIKQMNQPPEEWTNLKTAQEGKLASYRWVDQKRQIVAIPINLAMQLVTAEVAASGRPKPIPSQAVIEKPAAKPPPVQKNAEGEEPSARRPSVSWSRGKIRG